MNRQELLNEINSSPKMQLIENRDFTSKREKEYIDMFKRFGRINLMKSFEKIFAFLREFSILRFSRIESISGDKLCIDISILCAVFFSEDIGIPVVYVGEISNSCGIIERFYMAEDGRIGRAAISNQGIDAWFSDDIDEFLNYLLTKEYDYHIPISERTYQKLHEAGWYEGRNVDISNIIKECEKHNVTLTQPQKEFLSEFAGIRSPDPYTDRYGFFIADKENYDNWDCMFSYYSVFCDEEPPINGEDAICVGIYNRAYLYIFITPDGRLKNDYHFIGRTVMEGWELILSENFF